MASLIYDQTIMSNLVLTYHKANVFDGSLNFDKSFNAKMKNIKNSNDLKNECIHSGHFMVSEIEENEENLSDKNEGEAVPETKEEVGKIFLGYPQVSMASCFNHKVSIDGSLTKLFQCMTLAYDDARLTSPRWKTFKGLKLNIKDKIRLNNIIWRAWHIQYISGRKPEVCQFSSATCDTERHKKTEAILLEGKYWKRKHNVIKAEYKKWRLYYQHIYRTETLLQNSPYDWENNLPRWSNNLSFDSGMFSCSNDVMSIQPPYNNMYSSGYGNYYEFINPREIARSGMGAEFMQPGLEQLQPSLDFMDTFEPMQDIFRSLPTVQEEPTFENDNLKETPEDLLNSIFAPSTEESSNIPGLFDSSNPMTVSNKINVGSSSSGGIECFNQSNKVSSPSDTFSYTSVNIPFTAITQAFTPISNTPINQVNSMSTSMDNLYKIDYNMTTSNPLPLVNNLESNSKINRFQQENQGGNNFSAQVMFYEQDSSKSLKNKYPYSSYLTTSNAQSVNDKFSDSLINVSQKSSNINSRLVNSSVNSAKNMTIKNLLNTPSLTSTMANNTSFGNFPSTSSTLTPNRNNIERSISLPIYDKKSELNGQAFLAKFSRNNSSTVNQFNGAKLKDSTYSMNNVASGNYFESGGRILSVNSPGSSNDSSFSNQESQCLPQMNNSPPQMNKLLAAGVDYGTGKLTDFSASSGNHQIYLQGDSSKSRIGKIVSSSLNSTPLSAYTPNASSSSSSPIGSFDSASNPNQTITNFSAGAFGKTKSIFQLSSRVNEHKRGIKKSYGSLDYGMKEKGVPETMSSSFASNSSYPSSKTIGREINFKHLSSPMHLSSSSFGSAFKSEDRVLYKERRRVCHINAEQKRRCNIKNGFDTLRNLLPSLCNSANTKVSKAAMLHKAADYIRILKSEKFEQQKEYDLLRQQVESLNQTIGVFQSQLPATGTPIVGQRISQIKEQYAEYVKNRTMENWKFWIFSIIMESLLDSYCNTVATTNVEEMYKTLNRWLDQNCCLITLRKDILKSLRYISTSTNILSNPEALQQDILKAIAHSADKLDQDEEDI